MEQMRFSAVGRTATALIRLADAHLPLWRIKSGKPSAVFSRVLLVHSLLELGFSTYEVSNLMGIERGSCMYYKRRSLKPQHLTVKEGQMMQKWMEASNGAEARAFKIQGLAEELLDLIGSDGVIIRKYQSSIGVEPYINV